DGLVVKGRVLEVVPPAAAAVGQHHRRARRRAHRDVQVAVGGVGDVQPDLDVGNVQVLADGQGGNRRLQVIDRLGDVAEGVGQHAVAGERGGGPVRGALAVDAVLVLVHRVARQVADVGADDELVVARRGLGGEGHVELRVVGAGDGGHAADGDGAARPG